MPSVTGPDRLGRIVKAYDVRGRVPQDWDASTARALGSAFAQVVVRPEGHERLVLGHDMRTSSPELAAAFADGALSQGVDVVMIGLCATDQLYFASGSLDLPGAMITASHNPGGDNGVKACRAGARPVGQDSGLAEIRDLARWTLERGELHGRSARAAGRIELRDVLEPYSQYLHSLVDLRGSRPLTVVVDAGNGMAGLTAPAVLDREGLDLTVVPLYCELDGTFPHHPANPLDSRNLQDLAAAVLEHGADLGLAFDGDADRCVLVDERGRPVSPSAVGALVAERCIAAEVAAGTDPAQVTVVHGVIASRALPELVLARGARAVRARVGHSFVKATMAEQDAVLGAEHSAHYYFRDFWYADTGMLAALHVLAALGSAPGAPAASELLSRFAPYPASGEINVPVADPTVVLDRVHAWGMERGAEVDRLDGLSLSGAGPGASWWWVNVRTSNTEPLLRLNVEAQNRPTLEAVLSEVRPLVTQQAPPEEAT